MIYPLVKKEQREIIQKGGDTTFGLSFISLWPTILWQSVALVCESPEAYFFNRVQAPGIEHNGS